MLVELNKGGYLALDDEVIETELVELLARRVKQRGKRLNYEEVLRDPEMFNPKIFVRVLGSYERALCLAVLDLYFRGVEVPPRMDLAKYLEVRAQQVVSERKRKLRRQEARKSSG